MWTRRSDGHPRSFPRPFEDRMKAHRFLSSLSLVSLYFLLMLWSTFQVPLHWHRVAIESMVDSLCACYDSNRNTCLLFRPCSVRIPSSFVPRVCPLIECTSSKLHSTRVIVFERLVALVRRFSFHVKRCRIESIHPTQRRRDVQATSTNATFFLRKK